MPRKKSADPEAVAAEIEDQAEAVGAVVEEIPTIPDEPAKPYDRDFLAADLRDDILERIKRLKKPWAQMSEEEKLETGNRVAEIARFAIHNVVMEVSSRGFENLTVELAQVNLKSGAIEGKIKSPNTDEARSILTDNAGSTILIVCADPAAFRGLDRDAQIEKDQPDLPLGPNDPITQAEVAELAAEVDAALDKLDAVGPEAVPGPNDDPWLANEGHVEIQPPAEVE